MAEPERDDRGVDAGVQQRHRAAVPQDVGVQLFGPRARGIGAAAVVACVADEAFDGVAAEPPAGAGREQRLVATPGAFGEPDAQHRLGGCGQRDGALFAAFAEAADVGAGAETDVAAVESDQLGDPQPGLDGERQQRAVAAAFPAAAVGRVDEGVDLGRR